jgi:hypothetical protein
MANNRKPSGGRQNRTDDKPSQSTSRSGENANPDANKTDRSGDDKKRSTLEWANFVLLFLAFIATAAAAYFTGQQWITADDTEKRQLRAYVGITPGAIENYGAEGQQFSFTRKNYGITPAYDLIWTTAGQSIIPAGNLVPVAQRQPPPQCEIFSHCFLPPNLYSRSGGEC